jgi:TolB protein
MSRRSLTFRTDGCAIESLERRCHFSAQHALVSTIAFSSTRDFPSATTFQELFNAGEIYFSNPDGTNLRRITNNDDGDAFAALSPNGKKLVLDSNRLRTQEEPLNTSDLFVMDVDGSELGWIVRGSSATWDPEGKNIAYHASASGTGVPLRRDPGSATDDSDIFALNVDDALLGLAAPVNLTNDPLAVDDDPDWSTGLVDVGVGAPAVKIAFTSHPLSDDAINKQNSVHAEIYAMNTDGSERVQLTRNLYEERGPAWSPDGKRIVFAARIGGSDFEICVMNSDGSGLVQLTNNGVPDLTPTWSPDGQQIVFHSGSPLQLWVMNANGTGLHQITNTDGTTPGINLLANWGVVRAKVSDESQIVIEPSDGTTGVVATWSTDAITAASFDENASSIIDWSSEM